MGKSKKDSKKDEARSEALRKDIDFIEHTWEDAKLYEHYGIDNLEGGLSSSQVLANRAKYGENRLTPPATTPWYIKYLMQYTNFFALLLIAGGLLCFIAYGVEASAKPNPDQTNLWLGVVLIAVVIITATFSYMQEASSDAIMEGFKNMIPKKCKAIRDGTVHVLDAWELVPGDVVTMGDGDQIPADICIKKATDFKVDNSSLTGESEPVDRTTKMAVDDAGNPITQPLEAENLVFYTTIVNSGAATGVVIGTGDRTVMGQIAGLATETSNEATPINIEIKKFIMLISAVAITLGVAFFIIGFVLGTDPISNVVFAIGIIVANVPEGLLATVTVSLALTAKRMHQKNVLVKNLEAVETLGSTTVIASDKTGTLTQNRMTVQHAWYDDKVVKTPSTKNHPQFKTVMSTLGAEAAGVVNPNDETFKYLLSCAILCNNSEFILKDPFDDQAPTLDLKAELNKPDFNLLQLDCTGDASESGLIKFTQMVEDYAAKRKVCSKIFEIKFNSTNKWQMSIHKNADGGEVPNLYLKGAPERVLGMCKRIMINGEEVEITPEWREKYTEAYEGLGGMGERVLGFAYKRMEGYTNDYDFQSKPSRNFDMEDLTFVGLFSLIDPPREGVPEAVAKCKRARIKVFMVTGDHPITAQAIAKQVGIIDQDKWDAGKATVVKGDDIRDWMEIEDPVERQARWDEALSHEQIVFARVSPAHKLLIVENNQRRGEVVAVTGDGVNDAPALKKGDIGVAMGIAGKDVSKEAADMILMDDNFASIVNGVEEGRLIFDNLKKSIAYTLTSNIPEIAPFLCYITVGLPLPISTVLILCVDLGTDMVPAISLAYEEKESDIMDRPPRNAATDRLVNRRLISFAYLQIGVMQALAGFYTYFMVLNDYGYAPRILMQQGLGWDYSSLMCVLDDAGTPLRCGYGCETVEDPGLSEKWAPCQAGCEAPTIGFGNPFTEFTDAGFRGFNSSLGDNATEATCGRSCAWYEANKANPMVVGTPLMTEADVAMFEATCAGVNASMLGFPYSETDGSVNRGQAFGIRKTADPGAFYWWNGQQQYFPNNAYQSNALRYAQTSYFVSIIVVQWADLLIAKTRKLSIFEQGMRNGFMNFGLCFETVLGILLVYLPFLNSVFSTRPLYVLHWFPGVPWSILIFVYDEIRKMLIRQNPGGWLEEHTYW
uniref:Cation-transporting P-type ATPase N-terminal domain-containing protein n=2 Tax=Eukaryota TaxID=2759 RepID=A0A7S1X1T7_9CHLO|mmetsp:Transcript_23408/g.41572  ORF Transcript_23408/g.41572 Transcript_23408/m.41572 type:complete len:1172 (+) Transcript_23408:103-3618(+)|eukprot:CAMPEP_0177778664 /NCGR_PEP_ID=MMETSP0491_2-20121128/16085_1 /TAXON_ID=63592 /ORGANISM="Tetraselmis chuii, Strain PLY429" /LENGTH=1171 /DNA_ID=CAMNT_0019297973 /DNA_START=1129 /DNA_END=4644 /DNA_ORIENTATION=+